MAGKRKTTRRQFLKGESAVEALADLTQGAPLESAEQSAAPGNAREGGYLVQVARPAMACEFAVFLNAGQDRDAPEVAVEVLDLVDALEDQLTVYRDHSEISRINQRAAEAPLPVEPRLFDLLTRAVDLSAATGGAFDITSGPLSKVWGFSRRAGQVPTDADLQEALGHVGSRWLKLDGEARTVHFRKPGIEINLGGIGKGYALDRCIEVLATAGIENFLIHGGLSSVAARGSSVAAGQGQSGWKVGVRHPLRPERRLAEIWLRDRALGTSGSGTQSFHHQGRRYGHILDPRSGRPAEGVLSSTVIAPTAAEADALATAFYVMGPDAALDFCRQRSELAAVIVTAGSRSGSVAVHTIGLKDDDWRCNEPHFSAFSLK